jgi:hypothetical protein
MLAVIRRQRLLLQVVECSIPHSRLFVTSRKTRKIPTTTRVSQQQRPIRSVDEAESDSSVSPSSRQSTGLKGIKNKLKTAWRQAEEELRILEAEEQALREKAAKIPGSKAMSSTALDVQSDNKLSINAEQNNAEEADFAEVSLCGLDPCEVSKVCSLDF